MLPKRKINPAFPAQGAVSSFSGFTPLFPPRLESVHSPSSHAVMLHPRRLHRRVFHRQHTGVASSPGRDPPAGRPALPSGTEHPELEGTRRDHRVQLRASHSTQTPRDCSARKAKNSIKQTAGGTGTERVRLPPVHGVLRVFKAQPGDRKRNTKQHIQKRHAHVHRFAQAGTTGWPPLQRLVLGSSGQVGAPKDGDSRASVRCM